MPTLHIVIFGHLLQLLSLLLPLGLLSPLLLMDHHQLQLLFVLSLARSPRIKQSPPVVHRRLPFHELTNLLVFESEHLLIDPLKPELLEQIHRAFEIHDLGFDCVVGGLDAPVLLFEGIGDDAD